MTWVDEAKKEAVKRQQVEREEKSKLEHQKILFEKSEEDSRDEEFARKINLRFIEKILESVRQLGFTVSQVEKGFFNEGVGNYQQYGERDEVEIGDLGVSYTYYSYNYRWTISCESFRVEFYVGHWQAESKYPAEWILDFIVNWPSLFECRNKVEMVLIRGSYYHVDKFNIIPTLREMLIEHFKTNL